MILVDISSIMHRMIFGSSQNVKTKIDGKLVTEEFIPLTLHYILSELIDIQVKYREYGEVVICFDDWRKTYWRRDVFPNYKLQRRTASSKGESELNYKEIYTYTNELFDQIKENTPWKCVYVNRAEADDIILVLAKEFHKEGVLILSPDKDFLQCQRVPGVKQYSSLTKKWLVPENKNKNMEHWIRQHVMLGDVSDGVPKVVDFTEFSENFKKHLEKYNLPLTVKSFKDLDISKKREVLESYDEKLYNKKGQDIGYDIYESNRFGMSNVDKIFSGEYELKKRKTKLEEEVKELRKTKKELQASKSSNYINDINDTKNIRIRDIQSKIKEIQDIIKNLKVLDKTPEERIDDFLNEHELYREHYERNFTMVMEEGISDYIRANILMEYNSASTDYNEDEFNQYLDKMRLSQIKAKLPVIFKSTKKLDITNCGWDF